MRLAQQRPIAYGVWSVQWLTSESAGTGPMAMTRTEVIAAVRRSLARDEFSAAVAYWDRTHREAGEPVRIAREFRPMPFDGTLVFVDLAPGANWAHPCVYLLIANDERASVAHRASFPPYRGDPPASYEEILLYGAPVSYEDSDRSHDKEKGEQ